MKAFLKILAIFLIWRFLLFAVGGFADNFLVYDPSFPYFATTLTDFGLPRWLYSWSGFDGVHYLRLLIYGYKGDLYIQAFFPIYPFLIKLTSYIFSNYLVSSLIVSNVSFIVFIYAWYKFIKEEYSSEIAYWSLTSILLFPTSFYFVATYTESLFLLFVLGTFLSLKKNRYWFVALFIALASATRVSGILLIPAVIFEIIFNDLKWSDTIKQAKNIVVKQIINYRSYLKPSLIISLGSIGLLLYMFYLYREFNDPLYFFHIQSEFGGGVRQESLISYPQVLWRYIKILVTVRPFDLKYYSYVLDLIVGTLGLAIIIYSATKTKLSYIVFALLSFFLPTLTGTFSSIPRYILICFPIFIILGIWSEKSKIFRYTWFITSSLLLVLNTVLFVQGYWIA
jgi:hypothetical protein